MDIINQTTKAATYSVTTPVYEGPLDLLLQLIEREELDITKIALAKVTAPFLAYVHTLDHRQAEQVSSFLVIAARLMQIKSEALLPRPPEREPGEEDPGRELIQQLVAYKRYKELSQTLAKQEELGLHTYLRLASPPKVEGKLDLSNITLDHLVKVAARAFALVEEMQSIDTVVRKQKVRIKDKINLITRMIKSGGKTNFSALLGENYTRVDVVVTFLALLELVKRFQITAIQTSAFGNIELEPTEQWDDNAEIEVEFLE